MADFPARFAESPFSVSRQLRLNRTKTVATVGPASSSPEMLTQLIHAGVDVFRLNMAHGCREDHQKIVDRIRAAGRVTNLPVGILVDLAGPKIRLGQLHTEPLNLDTGETVTFVQGREPAMPCELVCTYETLVEDVNVGDQIMVSDGLLRLQVEACESDRVVCRVIDGGVLRSRQGVNLPGVMVGVSALQAEDIDNAEWACQNEVEFVGLSFVRQAAEVADLKHRLQSRGCAAMIIAKIEKREALENLDAIVAEADAVMVARGDLGVEIEVEKTPLAQKRIIRTCGQMGKPVIVATQMLESMHHNRIPTRAEVSDVANAILDGADACMLSGETAIGQYPVEAVRMMRKIQVETESTLVGMPSNALLMDSGQGDADVTEAVMLGAAMIARRSRAKLVVIATNDARAVVLKSKQRDYIPVVGVTNRPRVVNRMSLLWGVSPILAESLQLEDLQESLRGWASESEQLQSGDRVVFVADTELWSGIHDTVMIWNVP